MFDSNEYAWRDLKVVLAGRPITGIRGIKFKVARTVTDIYAGGDKAHTRTKGNYKFSGEIKLLQSEAEALIDAAKAKYGPKANPTDLDFNVTANFSRGFGEQMRTHQMYDVCFLEFEMGMDQDDPNMEITFPVAIGDIEYAV